jgi:hypothetical protein
MIPFTQIEGGSDDVPNPMDLSPDGQWRWSGTEWTPVHPGQTTGELAPGGGFYWTGLEWRSTLSDDRRYRWNGQTWQPAATPATAAPHKTDQRRLPVGALAAWVSAALAALWLLLFIIGVGQFIVGETRGEPRAPGYLGIALLWASLTVLFLAPLGYRIARPRRLLGAGAVGAGVIFLGSCGGGMALVAAYPTQASTPAPTAAAMAPATNKQTSQTPVVTSSSPTVWLPAPTPTPSQVVLPTRSTAVSTQVPPTPPPPPPPPPAQPPPAAPQNLCGAPANAWGYTMCNTGTLVYNPPANFCNVFSCIQSFWKFTNGYVVRCQDGRFSHSGGRQGACSDHRGVEAPLYSS